MNSKITYFLLVVVIISLLVAYYKNYYVTKEAIIIRSSGMVDLKDIITHIAIIKTSLFIPLKYCSDLCSHWACMLKSKTNKYYILSSTRMQCLDLYYLDYKDIYFDNETNMPKYCYVQDYGNTRWMIQNSSEDNAFKEVIVPNLSLNEITYTTINLIRSIKYHLISYNCHFVATTIQSMYTFENKENLKYFKLVKNVIKSLKNDSNLMRCG